jgi:hypothetical protein
MATSATLAVFGDVQRCWIYLHTKWRSMSAKCISVTPHLRNVPIPACVGSDQKVVRKVSIST